MAADLTPLERWVAEELVAGVGLPTHDAHTAARRCCTHHGQPSPGDGAVAVCVARAVRNLPEAHRWWTDHADQATAWLLAGELGNIEAHVGEALVPPAPDMIDFNWPPSKVWTLSVPHGVGPGEEFLVGDGQGGRAWAEAIEREGQWGVVIVRRHDNPLDDVFEEAWHEAMKLIPPEVQRDIWRLVGRDGPPGGGV